MGSDQHRVLFRELVGAMLPDSVSRHLEPVPGDECLSPASEQRCVEEQLACSDAAPCCVSLTLLLSDMQVAPSVSNNAAL